MFPKDHQEHAGSEAGWVDYSQPRGHTPRGSVWRLGVGKKLAQDLGFGWAILRRVEGSGSLL